MATGIISLVEDGSLSGAEFLPCDNSTCESDGCMCQYEDGE